MEHLSSAPVYGEVLSIDTGRKVVSAVVSQQWDWLRIFGKFGLVEVQGRVTLQGKVFEERTRSGFCIKRLH